MFSQDIASIPFYMSQKDAPVGTIFFGLTELFTIDYGDFMQDI